MSHAPAARYPTPSPISAPAGHPRSHFFAGFASVPSHDGMSEPEAGMLIEHSQYGPLEGGTPASMRACAIHAPHARKNVARESRLTLTTHAMCMSHAEIAHEGSQ